MLICGRPPPLAPVRRTGLADGVGTREECQMDNYDAVAARGSKARANLVAALRECCDLAEAVETLDGQDLLEVLIVIDSLRFVMAESGQLLQGVVRGFEG